MDCPKISCRASVAYSPISDVAERPADLDLPGYRLHLLRGARAGQWNVRVSGNWRVVFRYLNKNGRLVPRRSGGKLLYVETGDWDLNELFFFTLMEGLVP